MYFPVPVQRLSGTARRDGRTNQDVRDEATMAHFWASLCDLAKEGVKVKVKILPVTGHEGPEGE